MHRRGHVGMALLAYAPVSYLLLQEGKMILAVGGLIGVLAIERLPDKDFWIPGLVHRGISHSLFCALFVGGITGTVGWAIGALAPPFLADLGASVGIFAGVFQSISELLQHMDATTLSRFGFGIGFFGILVHLFGDVITEAGIRPFLPVSQWRVSLSPINADNPVANFSLFGLGVLAIAAVLVLTAPAAILGAPATLSPIGTVSAQSANQSGTSVTFKNQTATNSTITIERVTLSDNGFVGIHTTAKNGSFGSGSLIGVSKHLSIGTHQNVTVNVSNLNATQKLVAVPYHDLNDNNKFNQKKVFGSGNATFTKKGRTVRDIARVRESTKNSSSERKSGQNQTANGTASVVFANQTTNGTAVTISSVTVPKGGFVVIHGPAYSQQGIISGSAITVSRYLSPGTHRNVTIQFDNGVPGAVSNISEFAGTYAPLSAVLYQDTNGNHHYDYVATFGANDTAYQRNGSRVDDQARVVTQEQLDRKTQPTAALMFTNQNAADGTLTVEYVSIPRGGFVVIHNNTYLSENDPLTSVVAHSEYLSAGDYRNVTISLEQPLRTQRVVAVAYRDTNGNNRYDYIRSGGMADYAYVKRVGNQTTIASDTANITGGAVGSNATPFRFTNLTVSNQSVHVSDTVKIIVWVSNPTSSRLETTVLLRTSGDVVSAKEVSLYPRERRAVIFTHTYEAPGSYVIKLGNKSTQIQVVAEGVSLASIENSTQSQSRTNQTGNVTTLSDIPPLVIGFIVLVFALLIYAAYKRTRGKSPSRQWK